jgi:hypothetical protein
MQGGGVDTCGDDDGLPGLSLDEGVRPHGDALEGVTA